MNDELVAEMAQIEAAQSILRTPIMQCIEQFGVKNTKAAIDWFCVCINIRIQVAEDLAKNGMDKN